MQIKPKLFRQKNAYNPIIQEYKKFNKNFKLFED